jgi:molecular chaperone DnaK
MTDQAEKVADDDRTKIEAAIADLKAALAGEDVADIKAKHDALVQASQEFAQRLYQATQDQADGTTADDAEASTPDDDEVADAEIVDEGDDENA